MTTLQLTKEDLKLRLEIEKSNTTFLNEQDVRLRKEFAKAFNWVKNAEFGIGNHVWKEPQLPSWEQIFVHLGRLLVAEESQRQAKEFMNVLSHSVKIPPNK